MSRVREEMDKFFKENEAQLKAFPDSKQQDSRTGNIMEEGVKQRNV